MVDTSWKKNENMENVIQLPTAYTRGRQGCLPLVHTTKDWDYYKRYNVIRCSICRTDLVLLRVDLEKNGHGKKGKHMEQIKIQA